MIQVTIPTLGTLPTFSVPTSAANYWQERAAYEHSALNNALNSAGLKISRAQDTDFTSYLSDMETGLDNYMARYEDILQNGFSSVVATLPDVLPIMAALLSGGSGAVVPILIQGVLDVLVKHTDIRSDHYDGDTQVTDVSGIEAKLETITTELETLHGRLRNTADINLADIMEKGLIDTNALDERYSLLWNLARQAIRVLVTSTLDLDDVLIESSDD